MLNKNYMASFQELASKSVKKRGGSFRKLAEKPEIQPPEYLQKEAPVAPQGTFKSVQQQKNIFTAPLQKGTGISTVLPKREEKTIGGFLKNVGSSGSEVISGLGEVIKHPIETLSSVGELGAGALDSISRKLFGDQGVNVSANEKKFNDVKDYYVSRYGSLENAKNRFYEDPAGVLLDASMVLEPAAGTVKNVGVVSKLAPVYKAGEVLGKTGEVINPINVAGKAIGEVRKVLPTPSKISKATSISEAFVPISKENAVTKASEVTGKVIQGSASDIPKAQRTFSQVNTKGVKTYTDLGNKIQDELITPLIKEQDAIFEANPTRRLAPGATKPSSTPASGPG